MILNLPAFKREVPIVVHPQSLRHPNHASHIKRRDYVGMLIGTRQRNSGSSIAVLPFIKRCISASITEESTSCLRNDSYARSSTRC